MHEDEQVGRRRFFLAGLRELIKPLAQAAGPIERALKEMEFLDRGGGRPEPGKSPVRKWIRPPGALEESAFRDKCSRCGICVSVCPANAIKLDPNMGRGEGFPFIVASEMACVVCDGLHCMQNCPSGALVFTPAAEIDIGTAVWQENLCVRRLGEDCKICVDQCPLGSAALVLEEGKVKVIEDGCTGCGVCEQQCPTSPKSITITPKSARSNSVARS